ncbi:MAG: ROK family protein [Candidatus Promineifilaceae bacterium]
MIFVGVDVGGTKTAVAVADRVGKLLSQQKRPTDVTQLVATIRDAIRAAVVDAGCACADIAAIGIGVPGMVNRVVGTVELATNLRIDRPLALGGLLAAEFNTPVLIENDARLGKSVEEEPGLEPDEPSAEDLLG